MQTALTSDSTSSVLEKLQAEMAAIPVDEERLAPAGWEPDAVEKTLASPFEVSGPSTYHRGNTASLHFQPAEEGGWAFERTDLSGGTPRIPVRPENVTDLNRNIRLSAGTPENFMRMSEHIIALRLGLGIDHAVIGTPNGDPPLFDVGSRPLVEAVRKAGLREIPGHPVVYATTSEPVFIIGPHGSFLLFEPAEAGCRKLTLDVALDFPTAIGRQRIRFDLTPETFAYGADARTNCSRKEMFLMRTIGRLIPSIRGFGYTWKNILVAGKERYANEPALLHNGKSLEAVWHRACLDLLAALALCPVGRPAGRITSYKAGHALDCRFMSLLSSGKFWRKM